MEFCEKKSPKGRLLAGAKRLGPAREFWGTALDSNEVIVPALRVTSSTFVLTAIRRAMGSMLAHHNRNSSCPSAVPPTLLLKYCLK